METLKERIENWLVAEKHRLGQHNQKRHGWRGGVGNLDAARRAMRSGVSADFEGQTTPTQERDAARARYGLAPIAGRQQFEAAQARIAKARDEYADTVKKADEEFEAVKATYGPVLKRHQDEMGEYHKIANEIIDIHAKKEKFLEEKRAEKAALEEQLKKSQEEQYKLYDDVNKARYGPDYETDAQWEARMAKKERLQKKLEAATNKSERLVKKIRQVDVETGEADWWKADRDFSKAAPIIREYQALLKKRDEIAQREYVKAWLKDYGRTAPGMKEIEDARIANYTAKDLASKSYVAATRQDAGVAMRYLRAEAARRRSKLSSSRAAKELAEAERERKKTLSEITQYIAKSPKEDASYSNQEYRDLYKKLATAEKKMDDLENEVKSALDLRAKNPSKLKTDHEQAPSEKIGADRDAGIEAFRSLMPANKLVDGTPVKVKNIPADKEQRAYQSGDSINLEIGYTHKATVVHELGHIVEDRDPAILAQSLRWRNGRTVGEKPQKLKDLAGGGSSYKDSEISRPDKFTSAYIGKSYGQYASEVLSMGLQMFFSNPAKLAIMDADMFDFIFAVVRMGVPGEV